MRLLPLVTTDLTTGNNGGPAYRIQIISPTTQSFDDYASAAAAQKLKEAKVLAQNTRARVIPNVAIGDITCPRDNVGCNSDARTNKSGQSLLDANLLKLRITYGIPTAKQVPLVGKFYTWALDQLGSARTDAFTQSLLQAQRIPIVVHTTLRMMSEPIENAAMASNPGAGNNGTPKDPGTVPVSNPLPTCPFYDPTCVMGPIPTPPICPGGGSGGPPKKT